MRELIDLSLVTLARVMLPEPIARHYTLSQSPAAHEQAGELLTACIKRLPDLIDDGRTRAWFTDQLEQYKALLASIRRTGEGYHSVSAASWLLFATIHRDIGIFCYQADAFPTAHNLFEVSYHAYVSADEPALDVALYSRACAPPGNISQGYTITWRIAIQQVLTCIRSGSDWIKAVDAVEHAINAPIPDEALRQEHADELLSALRKLKGTPIDELVACYVIQVPGAADPADRQQIIETWWDMIKSSSRYGDPSSPQAVELYVTLDTQTMLDDLRLKLRPPQAVAPHLTWHDVNLVHPQLAQAVPLRYSLTADVSRTGNTILELAHEITHAYSLTDLLGFAKNMYRAIHYACEIEIQKIVSASGQETMSYHNVLHVNRLLETQLDIAHRGEVFQATWMPWLEGVSMYCELLCNPKDDIQEIFPIHAALRSLIDSAIRPQKGESAESFKRRLEQDVIERFESIYDEALDRYARFRHSDYFSNNSIAPAMRNVYLFGYLLIRATVSAWENTLGRRLVPGKAAKLLLHATRFATYDMSFMPTATGQDPETAYRQKFIAWTTTLAGLSRDTLEMFFEEVEADSPGYLYRWENGIPVRVTGPTEEIDTQAAAALDVIHQEMIRMAQGKTTHFSRPEVQELPVNNHILPQHLLEIHDKLMELSTLLPVGMAESRILFFPENVATISTRTYAGRKPGSVSADDFTRYATRSFDWSNPPTIAEFQEQCHALRTARVLTTRIIDLKGHPWAPVPIPHTSYVCDFLDRQWHRVSSFNLEYTLDNQHRNFIELLQDRIFTPIMLKGINLTIDKEKLLDRFHKLIPRSPIASRHAGFDVQSSAAQTALSAAAQAFNTDTRKLEDLLTKASASEISYIADFLYKTGRGFPTKADHRALKAPAAFLLDFQQMSGIIPFHLK